MSTFTRDSDVPTPVGTSIRRMFVRMICVGRPASEYTPPPVLTMFVVPIGFSMRPPRFTLPVPTLLTSTSDGTETRLMLNVIG